MEKGRVASDPAPRGVTKLPGPPLLKQVLELAFLLLDGARTLIRAALGLQVLITGNGAGGLFEAALGLVHRPFGPVLAAGLTTASSHKPVLPLKPAPRAAARHLCIFYRPIEVPKLAVWGRGRRVRSRRLAAADSGYMLGGFGQAEGGCKRSGAGICSR